jgi:WD40 repeat protein/tRNA A-37 threonylcarbamoyl transferase component Bud32
MGVIIPAAVDVARTPLYRIGEYELLEEIGRGGMGVVFKARHVRLHRVVALKMILGGLLARAEDLQRFENEAAAAAQLQHPNIVALYEVGTHDGQPYFSMEYVSGTSLAQRLTLGVLPGRRAASYLERLARAVHYAHGRGVIHRDLKPANVLLDEEDQPKITDFGLAKSLQSNSGQTRTGAVVGTPSYMAPEQATASKDLGPACDVYSLGAILYELLTGSPPFRGETALATLALVAEKEPVPPRLLNPHVGRDLETVCLKCLEKEPARRYSSAADLADDLRRYLDGEPIAARRLGSLGRGLKWVRRKPAVAALLAVVLLAVAGFTGFLWRSANEERRLREEADRQRVEAEKSEHLAQVREKSARYLWYLAQARQVQHVVAGADLKGAELLLAAWVPHGDAPDLREWEWYYLKGLCEGRSNLLAHTGRARALAFRSDGKRLATAGGPAGKPGEVKVWDPLDGRLLSTLPPGHTDAIESVAFSPDGRLLATGGSDRTLRLWDAESGKARAVLRGHTRYVTGAAFSPDGKRLVSTCGDGLVRLWDVARALAGQDALLLELRGHSGEVTAAAFSPDGNLVASAGLDETVRLWDAATGEHRHTLRGHEGEVLALAFSPNGSLLVSAGGPGLHRGQVLLWDPATGKQVGRRRFGLPGRVLSVAVSRTGRVAAGSNDGLVHVWDDRASSEAVVFRASVNIVWAVAFSRDGRLASAGGDGRVRLWHGDGGQEALRLDSPPLTEGVAFSRDGQSVAVCGRSPGSDGQVRVWRLTTQKELRPRCGHQGQIFTLTFGRDGRQLATGGQDQTVRLYDLDDPDSRPQVLRGLPGRVLAVAFHPTEDLLAAAGDGKAVFLWDTRTGEPAGQLDGNSDTVRALAFSPDGRLLASGGDDKTIHVWDLKARTGFTLAGHLGAVTALAFRADGKQLASAGLDRSVCVWDLAKKEHQILMGLGRPVTGLAYHPHGQRLAGVSDGRSVYLWDLVTRQQILELAGTDGVLRAVAFSPDGRSLAAAGHGSGLRMWQAAAPRP